jgi:hypothetical protein
MKAVKYHIFEESWNSEGEGHEQFCEEIFVLKINQFFTLKFMPAFDLLGRPWPPYLPNLDFEIDSVDIARYVDALFTNVLVLPDRVRAGEVEYRRTEMPSFDENESEPLFFNGLIFYLMPSEYSIISSEIGPRARGTFSAFDTHPLSELKGTALLDFVLNKVLVYVEENLGEENPDWLHHIAKSEGLIPVKDIQLDSPAKTPKSHKSTMLQAWQDAIMKYQNRLAEFIRLAGRSSDKSFLQEFENKVKVTRKTYLDALAFDPNGERLAWKEKFFADIAEQEGEVKALFGEIGFEW